MSLTIVMYHYVRDLARSRYPRIKARDVADFREQLDFIAANFSVVSGAEVVAAVAGRAQLPEKSCWLTFDDGYSDHYTAVFPLLQERGWSGSFFAPAAPVLTGRLLDINKIHFTLASASSPEALLAELRRFLETRKKAGENLLDWDDYQARYSGHDRLDEPAVIFAKNMLQWALPLATRTAACDYLFAKFVSDNERAFAAELYLSPDQIREMLAGGMQFGSHGYSHSWLNTLDRADQAAEIDRSLDFLANLGVPRQEWVMCYPHGGYDADTLALLRDRGCAVAVTTKVAVADLRTDPALELPRLDTVDLPCAS